MDLAHHWDGSRPLGGLTKRPRYRCSGATLMRRDLAPQLDPGAQSPEFDPGGISDLQNRRKCRIAPDEFVDGRSANTQVTGGLGNRNQKR